MGPANPHAHGFEEGFAMLKGHVELDEANIGGHRPSKRGRGAAGKTSVMGMAQRIFIDGGAGTTGLGIHARLDSLPGVERLGLPPKQRKDLGAKKALMERVTIVVLCLPDEAARESVAIAAALGEKSPRIRYC